MGNRYEEPCFSADSLASDLSKSSQMENVNSSIEIRLFDWANDGVFYKKLTEYEYIKIKEILGLEKLTK